MTGDFSALRGFCDMQIGAIESGLQQLAIATIYSSKFDIFQEKLAVAVALYSQKKIENSLIGTTKIFSALRGFCDLRIGAIESNIQQLAIATIYSSKFDMFQEKSTVAVAL